MPEMRDTLCHLPHLAALRIEGKDAAGFLHGQVTCDVKGQVTGTTVFGGICTPKGRVLATFRLYRHLDDLFYMLLPAERLERIAAHLERYRLRSMVEIKTSHPHRFVMGALGERQAKDRDLKLPWPGKRKRYLCLGDEGHSTPSESELWQILDMEDGRILIGEAVAEMFTPHMLGMDQTEGISLNKGCYTGQEVVARTHYLGEVKRRPSLWEVSGTAEAIPGEKIVGSNDAELGTVIACHNKRMAGVIMTGTDQHSARGGHSAAVFRLVSIAMPLQQEG